MERFANERSAWRAYLSESRRTPVELVKEHPKHFRNGKHSSFASIDVDYRIDKLLKNFLALTKSLFSLARTEVSGHRGSILHQP